MVNKSYMNKKEYLEKIENLISNKIKYHAPNLNDDNIDFPLLNAVGIDTSLPVFIFKKPLNKLFYTAFLKVKKYIKFNLILLSNPIIKKKRLEKLDNTFVMLEEDIGSNLLYSLDALNINYLTHSDYKNIIEEEQLLFNDKKIEFDFLPYYFTKKLIDNGVIFQATNFILNGKNYIINITNTHKENKVVNFEINIPLPRGYYFFKQLNDAVMIENLTSKQKAYFNYHLKNAKIRFSNMNGIESSTFACINLKCEIKLLPLQNKKIFLSYGEQKYCFHLPNEMQEFFELSQQKINQIFDIKVSSHDKQFDELFNCSLPRNIWEKWQNFDVDEKSENEWLKLKSKIIKLTEKGLQINQDFKGLKEVKIYRNLGWKRVFIVHNKSCYMYADNVKYFNYTLLTKEIFKKNNEIYLSFAN